MKDYKEIHEVIHGFFVEIIKPEKWKKEYHVFIDQIVKWIQSEFSS